MSGREQARQKARDTAAQALAELRQLRERLSGPRERQAAEWSGLRLQQRLRELPPSAASAEQLGPLNTALLVPRVLQRLHQLSPAYLQRLATQLDALAVLPAEAMAKPVPKKQRPAAPRAANAAPARRAAGRTRPG